MAVPIKYRGGGESSIASYNYSDISEGTGVSVFYGMNSPASGASNNGPHSLTKTSIYSGTIKSSNAPATSWGKSGDYDFDLSFNLPQRIRGKLRLAITNVFKGSASGATSSYIVAKARHWDGTTETELGEVTSSTGTAVTNTVGSKMHNLEIDIPETHFKKGETLRITIEVYAITVSGAGAFAGIAHDPKGRADDTILLAADSSTMEVHVPFVLDL